MAADADGDSWWYGTTSVSLAATRAARASRVALRVEGSSLGAQFQVNSFTTGFQRLPAVGAAADGKFVVVWSSEFFTGDGLPPAIVAQRFGVAAGVPVAAMSRATRFALGAALLLLGAGYALRRRS